MDVNSLSLSEKIFQMFILGFSGTELCEQNINIQNAAKSGLGGVILFSENIISYNQAAHLTSELQKLARMPLFISIDQEGGKVERTINVKNKINYLAPMDIAATNNPEKARQQAEDMVKELKSIGVNMNFAPVLDVNTCVENPIIGIRSFGSTPETVIRFAKPVYTTLLKNGITPVVKHFPGHGDTREDSHHTMPCVDLAMDELESQHIAPFKEAFSDGINVVMVAHACYEAFDTDATPASLSKNVIKSYLRGKMGFDGLVLSDDMVMGGVKNYYDGIDACLKGIDAGIDMFIFRNSDESILSIIHKLVECVENGVLSENTINESVRRILACKLSHLSV